MWDWSEFWSLLGSVADASSLVAAAASGYAAIRIRRISAKLAFNVKADEVLKRVNEHAKWIELQLIDGCTDVHLMQSKIARCKAEIDSVKQGVSGNASAVVRQLSKQYKDYSRALKRGASEDDKKKMLWELYNSIAQFCIYAGSEIANQRMGVSDASA